MPARLVSTLLSLFLLTGVACQKPGVGIGSESGGAGDTTPPTLSVVSPAANATVSGTAAVSVTASDNVGVASVALDVDGSTVQTDTAAPWQFNWDTTSVADGTHTLRLTARDAAGNSAFVDVTVTVDNTGGGVGDVTPPAITLTSPADGAIAPLPAVTARVTATDNVGVVRVEVRVDGNLVDTVTTPPWNVDLDLTGYSWGDHTLELTAFDAAGNSQSDSATIRVTPAVVAYVDFADLSLLDYTAVTHVALAYLEPQADGSLTPAGSFSELESDLATRAHAAGRRVLMSVGGWGHCDNFPGIAASAPLRQAFATAIVNRMAGNGYDGVDLQPRDVAGSTYPDPGVAGQVADFTALVAEVYSAVKAADPDYTVTVSGFPGWSSDSVDWAQLAPVTDYAIVFGFGYGWQRGDIGDGPILNPLGERQTAINGTDYAFDVRGGVGVPIGAGYPAEKIVVCLSFQAWDNNLGANGGNVNWSAVRAEWDAGQPWTPDTQIREVELSNGKWATTPECIPLKLEALLTTAGSVLPGGTTVSGIGWWHWGAETSPDDDLTRAVKQWIANQ